MIENYLRRQLHREQQVILAMKHRPWWRVGVLLRRPWRRHGPFAYGFSFRELRNWTLIVHDCADPAIGCSCSGSFRFPPEP